MKFGPVPVGEAEGAILAHAMTVGETRLRKAHVVTADDIALFKRAGIAEVVAAVLSSGDLDENAAAARLAEHMVAEGIEARPPGTGRVNLHARAAGLFTVDKGMVDALNAIDPAITLATLPEHAAVEAGQMVATVKIIPFAVPGALVEMAEAIARRGGICGVRAFRSMRVGVVQTTLPGLKPSILDKTLRVTEARLDLAASRVGLELRTRHEPDAVAAAITSLLPDHDMIVVFGASALCDDEDVIPAAIRIAGGAVERAGMPVDPGNLLVLGKVGGKPVVGAPGCARSPKENGFDWVLNRIIAGMDVTDADIAGMGVGGLLMEIPTRPQPRETPTGVRGSVHALVLAAGRSSRMGGPNKLMALFDGKPLIRQTAERALASRAGGTVVVTGHQAQRVAGVLDGLPLRLVDNPDFASGLAGSLRAGIAALPRDAAGALIVLGDMPAVSSADLDRLIGAFEKAGGQTVVRATFGGKRGNPVLLPRALFAGVARLDGDTGARHLIETAGLPVIDIEIGEAAAIDVDTPDALEVAGGILQD